ncbi:Protein MAIN-LIKE 1 [Glycine max]|nr:Protein MAIN-LIKE 1 [Glycine max]
MIRTRGLHRALRRVIGRALGTHVNGDADEAHQYRRSIAYARRQQAVAAVADNVEHVDHPADEVHEQSQEPLLMMRAPNLSVLIDYVYHVVATVWVGEECPKLKLSSHGRKVEGIVATTGLSPLIACSLDTDDRGFISVFVEREITITLNDVASLLHLPIIGVFHNFDVHDVDQVMELLVELLEVSTEEAKDETLQTREAYVRLAWLRDIYHSKCCTLFANKSATHVHVVFLDAFHDLIQSGSYSWGVTALVHMYDNLNDASKRTARQHAGYITCYRKPRACQWKSGKALLVSMYHKRFDRLTSDAVCWIPYGDHRSFREFELISFFFGQIRWCSSIVIHRPKRVVRRLVMCRPFLHTPIAPSSSIEEIDNRWIHISEYLAPVSQICVAPGQCAADYIKWFYMISHPFMSPTQPGDPSRHPPVVHDETFIVLDPPQQLFDATAMPKSPAPAPAPDDVDMPRHAVEAYQ